MTSWLRGQKKSELVDIAETVGLKNVSSLKKSDLESALDEYLTDNASQLSSDSKLAPYYNIRAKSIGSPVKREAPDAPATARSVVKRRTIKPVVPEESVADDESSRASASTLVARTPARALSLASRIPLPATPAEVVEAVDRSAIAVRRRVVSLYTDSGFTDVTQTTRESLSTVFSIVLLVSFFELYFLRPELLRDRYAFTIPAVKYLGTAAHPVYVPDFFLLVTRSFWHPALLWFGLAFAAPALLGYFFNLSAASGSHSAGSASRRTSSARAAAGAFSSVEYLVDPLTFSVAKALLVFVVLAQGATLGGWVDDESVLRINSALYGGWKGALVGTAITGLASLYDAVLRK